jgi:anthranilate phosphoribosyltransferase
LICRPKPPPEALREHHFAFFFAPFYHPGLPAHHSPRAKFAPQRGQRTLFNLPRSRCSTPRGPPRMLVGVPRPELCSNRWLRVLQSLGVRRAMVVSGQVGNAWLDELSTLGDNVVAEFYQERGFADSVISPGHFAIQPAVLADLAGGWSASAKETCRMNAEIIRRLLRNEDTGPKRDAVLLNAGAALFVAGKIKSIGEGWDLAAEILASGRAKAKLDELADNK